MGPYCICLEVTQRCNNACRHCYNFWRADGHSRLSGKDKALSREQVRQLIAKVKQDTPLKYVAISGGEPLLRRDLPQIVADLVDLGVQPIIITNGVLLDSKLLEKLPRDIGFEITLLGHNAEIHDKLAGRKVFERVIWNASRIRQQGSHLTVVFVATRLNALDAFKTIELGIALGADSLMYNRVNLSRGTKRYAKELVPSARVLAQSLGQVQKAVVKYGILAACSVPIPPCAVDITKYPNINFGWCPRGGDDSYYTIGCNGQLRPCNHSSVVLGDLGREEFLEILSRDKCKRFWEIIPPECIKCSHPLKDKCRGGCTAAADEFYGSQLRADPICELAKGYG
jgi:MoaA/NifB/PqqE/SkfB family radical SAM enzyme